MFSIYKIRLVRVFLTLVLIIVEKNVTSGHHLLLHSVYFFMQLFIFIHPLKSLFSPRFPDLSSAPACRDFEPQKKKQKQKRKQNRRETAVYRSYQLSCFVSIHLLSCCSFAQTGGRFLHLKLHDIF